ncbi:MAG: DUF1385 domain-containing protein [Clostridia bacterium]|nr:DUF1385 domain-containing protein [Clostridia bacterium]
MKKNNEQSCCPFSDRLGKVGGQAVLEGVMMKAGSRMVTTCRKDDGSLIVTDDEFVSVRQKHKILDLPIIRGVVSFVESMVMSFKTLGASADALGIEDEEEPSKFEKWLAEKLGLKLTDVVMVFSLILGLGLSALLFIFLPIWITAGLNWLLNWAVGFSMHPMLTAVIEGLVKMGIFVGYLTAVSFMPDIKRTFMYHGAEHKSIACFEAGEELTPENAKKHTRFHPRCGTSFMFFMILLGIFAGFIIKTLIPGLRSFEYTLIRLLILPVLMGVGYEFIRFAGKHPNAITHALSAPGLWMQRITTKEPDESMLEVAITSLKCALRDDYPEFMEFYEAKSWDVGNAESEEENAECRVENQPPLTVGGVTEDDGGVLAECEEQSDELSTVTEDENDT